MECDLAIADDITIDEECLGLAELIDVGKELRQLVDAEGASVDGLFCGADLEISCKTHAKRPPAGAADGWPTDDAAADAPRANAPALCSGLIDHLEYFIHDDLLAGANTLIDHQDYHCCTDYPTVLPSIDHKYLGISETSLRVLNRHQLRLDLSRVDALEQSLVDLLAADRPSPDAAVASAAVATGDRLSPSRPVYCCRRAPCSRAFGSRAQRRDHELRHTADKPFACPKCPKAYGDRKNLRTHFLRHHKPRSIPVSVVDNGRTVEVFSKRTKALLTTQNPA